MNIRPAIALSLFLITNSLAIAQTINQEELLRRTQQLMDAVTPGDQAPFKEYFAEDAIFFDEKGRLMDKPALVADVSPLPKGYSGTIKVVNPKSIIAGDAAIFSYDCDETEVVFGQPLHARYHETDTWMNRNGRWQIVAGQVLRYYEDPAPGQTDPKRFGDYVGTYQLATEVLLTVTTDGTNLYSQRSNRPKVTVIPEEGDIFFVKGVEGRRLFRRNASGRVDALIDRRNNEDILWKKVK